jgi:nucleotide-binding universal stress UspA family protein
MKLQERGTLLIPIDFTEQSLLAIKQAYNLAKYTHSKIVLLHSYEKVGEEKYDELKALTKQTETESGVPTEFMNVKGNIYAEVPRVAEEIEATLVIVGLESHMSTKNIVGASASKMIRECICPVISIREYFITIGFISRISRKSRCSGTICPLFWRFYPYFRCI